MFYPVCRDFFQSDRQGTTSKIAVEVGLIVGPFLIQIQLILPEECGHQQQEPQHGICGQLVLVKNWRIVKC
ncbi:hypothetical protein [Xenorhabdus budapestensis]|uniref:Transposase n=1 Tax=Xenorhabdus budapestensis TaxID=290110 RepID=A0ABX7VNL5_XENBU|nr:hypothetical protein [Xenorhabdus budapestensis]QTL41521.1 hypothetical protein HGO23_09580 [Xenorhabdus budapestensis]